MTIKELQKESHKIAKEKGWYEDVNGNFKDRNKAELLMLCVSELGEALEALRENRRQFRIEYYTREGIKTKEEKKWKKDTFEDELADTIIRICDMGEYMGIDLEWQIKKKMSYNKKRPKKHEKEF